MGVRKNIRDQVVSLITGLTPADAGQSTAFVYVKRGDLSKEPTNTRIDRKFTVRFGTFGRGLFFGDQTQRDWSRQLRIEIAYFPKSIKDWDAHEDRIGDDIEQIAETITRGANYVANQDMIRLEEGPEVEVAEDGEYWIVTLTFLIRYQESY